MYLEVIIRFATIEARENAARRGPKLVGLVGEDGLPEGGIRTQIQGHLRQTIALLECHGHALKRRFGEKFRKYVKFDDQNKSFLSQVKKPDSTLWLDILPEESREAQQIRSE